MWLSQRGLTKRQLVWLSQRVVMQGLQEPGYLDTSRLFRKAVQNHPTHCTLNPILGDPDTSRLFSLGRLLGWAERQGVALSQRVGLQGLQDPGYLDTSKIISEAAICLALQARLSSGQA